MCYVRVAVDLSKEQGDDSDDDAGKCIVHVYFSTLGQLLWKEVKHLDSLSLADRQGVNAVK